MYAQLGTFVFEGIKGFNSFSETFENAYAEQGLINTVPRLQSTGEKLRLINFIQWKKLLPALSPAKW